MRSLALFASIATAATLGLAGSAMAQASRVSVTLGPDLQEKVDKLGQREVDEQVARLQTAVGDALAQSSAYPDATAVLVLKDLKPNRPTFEQVAKTPGLDPIRSVSIGGASIEGEIIAADGRRIPVEYSYSTSNLADVIGYGVWWDANRAFDRFADRIEKGRYYENVIPGLSEARSPEARAASTGPNASNAGRYPPGFRVRPADAPE